LTGLVGRNGECDFMTIPEYRNKGYGYIVIAHYIRESIRRKVNLGWDCFVDSHSDKWMQRFGYTHVVREYDFVTFAK
jgi:hypothetical protein